MRGMVMVPGTGIEPVRCFHRGILSPLRLPISPPGRRKVRQYVGVTDDNGGWTRNRTEVHGFAGRCITTLPSSRMYDKRSPDRLNEKTPAMLLNRGFRIGAGNETRTRDPNLGKVVLYQLSYSRAAK